MKKLLALLLALVMALSMVACGGEDEEETSGKKKDSDKQTTEETTEENTAASDEETQDEETEPEETTAEAMTHAEFVAAEVETEVVVEFAIQGTQAYSEEYGNTSIYGADVDGGYYVYRLACTAEEAAKMTPGTWIRVTGYKADFAGQLEVVDATSIEFIEKEAYIAERVNVTELLVDETLADYMTLPVLFEGLTVVGIEYKNGEEGNDIYLTVSYNETEYSFCVETDLTNSDTEVYQTVAALEAGQVINVEAYMYWYEGPNPHVTAVTVAE